MCSYLYDMNNNSEINFSKEDLNTRYELLRRLKSDCENYLGAGHRNLKYLWSHDIQSHINLMRNIFFSFDILERPKWISLKDIQEYENRMLD